MGKIKDHLCLVTGPVAPSGNESRNGQADTRSLPLQPKSYIDDVMS
jgi:hypothetical protein